MKTKQEVLERQKMSISFSTLTSLLVERTPDKESEDPSYNLINSTNCSQLQANSSFILLGLTFFNF